MYFKKLIPSDTTNSLNNTKTFRIGTYILFFLVSAGMTVLNIITDKGFLTICTGVFAILCIINIILTLIGKIANSIANYLFAIEVLCMFTFFLVSGNPDGFSAIWICMLPAVSMLFFNRHKGSVLCAIMFAILIFFLWIPYGSRLLLYDYNDTFKMRFPVLYVAFLLIAYYMELKREKAYSEMHKLQDYYRDLSMKDALTSLYNRQGMYSNLKSNGDYCSYSEIYAVMFDIDDFKNVNDRYGHDIGDYVLQKFSEIIYTRLNAITCRWGGEEFVAVFTNDNFSLDALETVRKEFGNYTFHDNQNPFTVTVSMGVHSEKLSSVNEIDTLISKADEALYIAKSTGKNRIVFYKNI